MRPHFKILCFVLLLCIIGILGFSLWSRSQVKGPYVIVIGNPTEIPSEFRSKLPTGYSWIRKDDEPATFPGTPDSEIELFILKEEVTDIDRIMQWAREQGKKEIYFFYVSPPGPDEIIVNFQVLDFEFAKYDWINWEESLLNLVSPKEAFADSIPGPGCTSVIFKPAGSCYTFGCDFSPCDNCTGDGLLAKTKTCIYYDHYTCHGISLADHLLDNIWGDAHTNADASFADCMNAHNSGSPFMCYPNNLIINAYKSTSPSDGFPCTGSGAWGCANQGQLTTPRKSIDKQIWVAQNKVRDNLWLIRHEAGHTYGYSHPQSVGQCDDFQNIDSVRHCCSSHIVHDNVN